MSEVNSERQYDDTNDSNSGSKEGSYENYQLQKLPEGYTGYRGPVQVAENDYDRYDSDYEASETPQQEKKACPKIGWLLKLLK